MRLRTRDYLVGECEACGKRVEFSIQDDGDVAYYNAAEVVDIWMQHQLEECGADIDNQDVIS